MVLVLVISSLLLLVLSCWISFLIVSRYYHFISLLTVEWSLTCIDLKQFHLLLNKHLLLSSDFLFNFFLLSFDFSLLIIFIGLFCWKEQSTNPRNQMFMCNIKSTILLIFFQNQIHNSTKSSSLFLSNTSATSCVFFYIWTDWIKGVYVAFSCYCVHSDDLRIILFQEFQYFSNQLEITARNWQSITLQHHARLK